MNEQKSRTAREDLVKWAKGAANDFISFLKPDPNDNLILKIVKSILKIPVALFVVLVSPVLLLILVIIFVILL